MQGTDGDAQSVHQVPSFYQPQQEEQPSPDQSPIAVTQFLGQDNSVCEAEERNAAIASSSLAIQIPIVGNSVNGSPSNTNTQAKNPPNLTDAQQDVTLASNLNQDRLIGGGDFKSVGGQAVQEPPIVDPIISFEAQPDGEPQDHQDSSEQQDTQIKTD